MLHALGPSWFPDSDHGSSQAWAPQRLCLLSRLVSHSLQLQYSLLDWKPWQTHQHPLLHCSWVVQAQFCAGPSAICQLQPCSWTMQLMQVFLGPLEARGCHSRSHRGWPVAMQAPQLTAEQEELDNDESALAEFLADLKASSSPPAATRGTRTLPELPTSSSSSVGAPQPANTQSLEVRCLACHRSELVFRLWVPDPEILARRSCSIWPAAGK